MVCQPFRCWDSWESESAPEDERVPVRTGRDRDLRVSQAERDEVAAALARHYADGRLSVGEYEERVGAALEARTGRDLDPLLADLPSPGRRELRGRHDWRPPPHAPRVAAVAAVIVLAVMTGPWALWLLWPALVLTGRHAGRAPRRPHPGRTKPGRTGHHRPATQWL